MAWEGISSTVDKVVGDFSRQATQDAYDPNAPKIAADASALADSLGPAAPPPSAFQMSEMQYNPPPPAPNPAQQFLQSTYTPVTGTDYAGNPVMGAGNPAYNAMPQSFTGGGPPADNGGFWSGVGSALTDPMGLAQAGTQVTQQPGQIGASVLNALPLPGGSTLGGQIANAPGPIPQIGDFATQSAGYALTGEATIPLIAAQTALGMFLTSQQVGAGDISAQQGAKQLALNLAPILAPELIRLGIHTVPAAIEWAKSPEGQAAVAQVTQNPSLQRMGGLAGERGSVEPPKIPGEGQPPIEPGAGANAIPAGGDNPPPRPPAAVYDEYTKLYGPAAEQKMIEAGILPPTKPVPPQAGAEALGLGAPAPEPPMAAQLHVPVSEIPPTGSLAQRLDAKPMPVDEAALQVTDWLRKGEKARPEQEAMFQAQRAAQTARMEAVFQANGPDAAIQAKIAGAGAFQRPTLAPLDLTPEAEALIRSEINTSPMFVHPGERISANTALDAMKNGQLPQPAQGAQLGKILGAPFVEQLGKVGGRNYKNILSQLANAPRALMTMGDLSAAGRQAIIVAPRHPVLFGKAFGAQLKAFGSADAANAAMEQITAHPDYHLLEGRVQLLDPGTNTLGLHEESFQAPFLERIPGVGQVYKASERAFTTMTNKVRWDYAYDTLDNWRAAGKTPTPEMLDNLGLYVNNLTGRGTLPRVLADHSSKFNAVFFAPKFVASRLQLVGDLLRPSQSAEVRMMAAQDLGTFVATGMGVLGAMKYFGGINVGIDPRSSDFGKYTVMGQHHDFWAGFSPIARLIAQEATGQRVNSTGDVTSRDRTGAFLQFLRTKLAPIPGLAVDIHQGTDQGGNTVDAAAFGKLSMNNPVIQRITPMFLQDTLDSYKQGGVAGAAIGAPSSILGEGISAYPGPSAKQQAASDFKNSGFQQIQTGGWKNFGPGVAKAAGIPLEGKTIEEYKAAFVAEAIKHAPQDMPQPTARQIAGQRFDALPQVKSYQQKKDAAELNFWKTHLDVLKQYAQTHTLTVAQKKLLGLR